MSLDKGKIQEFVDEAVEYYESESIFGEIVTVRTGEVHPLPSRECRIEGQVSTGLLNQGMALSHVRGSIDAVTSCEVEKILDVLDGDAELREQVEADEFSRDLFTASIKGLPQTGNHRVLLPRHVEYQDHLDAVYGVHEYLPHSDHVPIHWFDADLFPRQGFVINSHVRVTQETHGERWSILNDDLNIGELDDDNSDNRLKIHIGKGGRNPVKVSFWTEFSDPQTTEDDICVLDLPDPGDVELPADD